MSRRARVIVAVVVAVLLVGGIGYLAYVGAEGSRVWSNERRPGTAERPTCNSAGSTRRSTTTSPTTPSSRHANPDLTDCAYQGTKAGDEIVTDDGIHIAGWYVPAGNGAGTDGPDRRPRPRVQGLEERHPAVR